MGGRWESLIKFIKCSFESITSGRTITEELLTTLCCVNSRAFQTIEPSNYHVNRDLRYLHYIFILTTIGTRNNFMCFLLRLLVSIRKETVEVSHDYEKLTFKFNVVKFKVTKPRVQYYLNLIFFIFQPPHSVLPGNCFLIQI